MSCDPDPPFADPIASCASPPVRLRDPGEVVAALPTVLGFHPQDSLVLLGLGGAAGRTVGLTLRVDLPPVLDPEGPTALAALLLPPMLRERPDAALAVLVAPEGAAGGLGSDRAHWFEVVAPLLDALDGAGIGGPPVVWATGTRAGDRWTCLAECGCVGPVADVSATAMLAATVAAGTVVRATRSELAELIAPVAPRTLRRRERLLIAAHERAAQDWPPTTGSAAGAAAVVDAAVLAAAGGTLVLDDERVVALACALARTEVRDVALLRCAGPRPAAAEQLWTALVRETPDPEAAEPAVLLAVSALLRGDGALANIALDRADQAWPGHRMGGLLRAGIATGLRPTTLREWLSATAAG